MLKLFNEISFKTSSLITNSYSTSFSSAVSLLDRESQNAIFSIYGFVRFADEIVDTFHDFDKKELLEKFEKDYYDAIEKGISLNPVLNSFQLTVRKYNIPDDLIQSFLTSMKTDLIKQNHVSESETDSYIYGSAEVVGLMCLRVFVDGNETLYNELEVPARKLGSAFQKVNFLRDIKTDTEFLKRQYFFHLSEKGFTDEVKNRIADDIEGEFNTSMEGLKRLPDKVKPGVLIAYMYFRRLLHIIRKTPAKTLMSKRIRVPDRIKLMLLLKAYLTCRLKLPAISKN